MSNSQGIADVHKLRKKTLTIKSKYCKTLTILLVDISDIGAADNIIDVVCCQYNNDNNNNILMMTTLTTTTATSLMMIAMLSEVSKLSQVSKLSTEMKLK